MLNNLSNQEKLRIRKIIFGNHFGQLLGEGADKFGKFKESYGGGTPLDRGQKAPSEDWKREHRVSQPRDEEGQFTYNSVNGIKLKYGPSRGKTENPLLKGAKLKIIKEGTKLKFGTKEIVVGTGELDLNELLKEYVGIAGWEIDPDLLSKKEGRRSKEEREVDKSYLGEIDTEKSGETQKEKRKKMYDRYKSTFVDKFFQKKEMSHSLTREEFLQIHTNPYKQKMLSNKVMKDVDESIKENGIQNTAKSNLLKQTDNFNSSEKQDSNKQNESVEQSKEISTEPKVETKVTPKETPKEETAEKAEQPKEEPQEKSNEQNEETKVENKEQSEKPKTEESSKELKEEESSKETTVEQKTEPKVESKSTSNGTETKEVKEQTKTDTSSDTQETKEKTQELKGRVDTTTESKVEPKESQEETKETKVEPKEESQEIKQKSKVESEEEIEEPQDDNSDDELDEYEKRFGSGLKKAVNTQLGIYDVYSMLGWDVSHMTDKELLNKVKSKDTQQKLIEFFETSRGKKIGDVLKNFCDEIYKTYGTYLTKDTPLMQISPALSKYTLMKLALYEGFEDTNGLFSRVRRMYKSNSERYI